MGALSHECYNRRMTEVASRELRNNTRSLLDRVEAGEQVTITADGRPVAVLRPVGRRPRWLRRDEFVRRVLSHQADAALRGELAKLAPDSTEDLHPL
ncbi:type II toxin-antitoxin system Phd/YefM family antitoxin [soil metagenome]